MIHPEIAVMLATEHQRRLEDTAARWRRARQARQAKRAERAERDQSRTVQPVAIPRVSGADGPRPASERVA